MYSMVPILMLWTALFSADKLRLRFVRAMLIKKKEFTEWLLQFFFGWQRIYLVNEFIWPCTCRIFLDGITILYTDNNIYFLGFYGLLILVLVSMQNKTPSEHEFTDLTEYIIKKNTIKFAEKYFKNWIFHCFWSHYLTTYCKAFYNPLQIFVTVTNEIGEWS